MGGEELDHLIDKSANIYLDCRRIYRLLSTDKVKQASKYFTEEDYKSIAKYIREHNVNDLQKLLDQYFIKDIDLMSIMDLREFAAKLGVKYYSRMSKQQLIQEIKEKTNGQKSSDKRIKREVERDS